MGLLLAGALALVVLKSGPPKTPAIVGADAAADADGSSNATSSPDAAPGDLDGGVATEDAGEPEPVASDAGTTLLDGEAPPTLGTDAPKTVTFGVILVMYKGAQGAPASTRSRDEAMALAKTLAEEAKTDFKAAVQKGDKGSMENAGRMPRGMLEPAPESVLFSLAKGAVSDPVETPRGFWIMQRIE